MPQTNSQLSPPLPIELWEEMAELYLLSIQSFTHPMRERRSRGEKHPVFDFLNTYYSLALGRLEKWHPGPWLSLQKPDQLPPQLSEKHYRITQTTITLDPSLLKEKETQRLLRTRNLLQLTQNRPPLFACHGLHEWAMVYKGLPHDIRHHESAPFRLSQQNIDQLVETRPITCTHFDAFRHFTPDALPLNRLQPTLDAREENEQPGCIHANMDLYKWAYKCMPWIGSNLLQESLLFAIKCREIDMRAAPYDLSAYGHYPPIKIETPEGRQEYEKHQKELTEQGRPIRQKIIDTIDYILSENQTNDGSRNT